MKHKLGSPLKLQFVNCLVAFAYIIKNTSNAPNDPTIFSTCNGFIMPLFQLVALHQSAWICALNVMVAVDFKTGLLILGGHILHTYMDIQYYFVNYLLKYPHLLECFYFHVADFILVSYSLFNTLCLIY